MIDEVFCNDCLASGKDKSTVTIIEPVYGNTETISMFGDYVDPMHTVVNGKAFMYALLTKDMQWLSQYEQSLPLLGIDDYSKLTVKNINFIRKSVLKDKTKADALLKTWISRGVKI